MAKRFYVTKTEGEYVVRDRHPYRGGINAKVRKCSRHKDAREVAQYLNENHAETPRDELPKNDTIELRPLQTTLEKLLDSAKQHGEESEPDHEVGDLQALARFCWELLAPKSRERVVAQFMEMLGESE